MTIQNDHGCDVEWNWRDEERRVGELDELIVYDDDVVRGDDGWRGMSVLKTTRDSGLTVDKCLGAMDVIEFLQAEQRSQHQYSCYPDLE